VKGEYNDEFSAKAFYAELLSEAERHPDELPYSWLLAKLRQIGLDAYTHNFTLNYPMGLGTVSLLYFLYYV
jgi:glycosylphosphatidylinositol transamidase